MVGLFAQWDLKKVQSNCALIGAIYALFYWLSCSVDNIWSNLHVSLLL